MFIGNGDLTGPLEQAATVSTRSSGTTISLTKRFNTTSIPGYEKPIEGIPSSTISDQIYLSFFALYLINGWSEKLVSLILMMRSHYYSLNHA